MVKIPGKEATFHLPSSPITSVVNLSTGQDFKSSPFVTILFEVHLELKAAPKMSLNLHKYGLEMQAAWKEVRCDWAN